MFRIGSANAVARQSKGDSQPMLFMILSLAARDSPREKPAPLGRSAPGETLDLGGILSPTEEEDNT